MTILFCWKWFTDFIFKNHNFYLKFHTLSPLWLIYFLPFIQSNNNHWQVIFADLRNFFKVYWATLTFLVYSCESEDDPYTRRVTEVQSDLPGPGSVWSLLLSLWHTGKISGMLKISWKKPFLKSEKLVHGKFRFKREVCKSGSALHVNCEKHIL